MEEVDGRYTEYENVYDFVEIKLDQLAALAHNNGRHDVSEMLDEVCDAYIAGLIDIVFVHGWPYTIETDANNNLNDNQ